MKVMGHEHLVKVMGHEHLVEVMGQRRIGYEYKQFLKDQKVKKSNHL